MFDNVTRGVGRSTIYNPREVGQVVLLCALLNVTINHNSSPSA